ncbi:hypothetical protein D3C87_1333540 [compost metagenome]
MQCIGGLQAVIKVRPEMAGHQFAIVGQAAVHALQEQRQRGVVQVIPQLRHDDQVKPAMRHGRPFARQVQRQCVDVFDALIRQPRAAAAERGAGEIHRAHALAAGGQRQAQVTVAAARLEGMAVMFPPQRRQQQRALAPFVPGAAHAPGVGVPAVQRFEVVHAYNCHGGSS